MDKKPHGIRVKELRLALKRIQLGRVKRIAPTRRISISALAEEAGIRPSTIHTRYPDIAEMVRDLSGKTARKKVGAKAEALADCRRQLASARKEINELRRLLEGKISRQATQLMQEAEGGQSGKVTAMRKKE